MQILSIHRQKFHQIEEGSIVNLEFDIIGKYISRIMHFEKD